MLKDNLVRVAVGLSATIVWASLSGAQQWSQASWSGWARCEISVSGQGYSDQQTHTWTMSGGTPTVSGAFRVHPATWSVVGGGSSQRTQGNQTLTVQWATNAPNLSAPLAVFVRASDGRMFIQARHAQLRAPQAVTGYQQLTIDGNPQMPGRVGAEAFEWAFPVVEVSRPKPGANAIANGSSTPVVNGKVGFMQPAGTQATASCTWKFGEGSAAPEPPPTVAAQATPTPGAGVATTPPLGQGSSNTASCVSAPQALVATAAAGNVTLKWSAPTTGVPTSYVVQAGSQPGGANLANFDTGSTHPSLVASSVSSGSYYVRVYGKNASCAAPTFLGLASNEVLMVVP